jgi:hypothetical protein
LADFFGLLTCRFSEGAPDREPARGMRGGWRVASNDDELCIDVRVAKHGFIELSISLASDMWNPAWVVRVNLSVASADLPKIAASVTRLARYAAGVSQASDAEPGAAADPRRQPGSPG